MADNLDIDTPKGKRTVRQEWEAYAIFHEMHPEAKVVETPKGTPALVDGVIVTGRGLAGAVETKCRSMGYEKLRDEYGSWMVKLEQFDKGRRGAAAMLGVPYFGFLYLTGDERLLIWKVSDRQGNWAFDFDTQWRDSQKNVNTTETKRREMAFLPLEDCVEDSEGENKGALLW